MTATTETPSAPYHQAVSAAVADQDRYRARFLEIRDAYDRFYDMAAEIGDDKATAALPQDAELVKQFEAAAPDRDAQMKAIGEALNCSLEEEIRRLATASLMSEGSIIGRLRSDLIQLDNYRKIELDGINGAFWSVIRHGHGASTKESRRMINRILSAWCDVYEISSKTMVEAATTIELIPDEFIADNNIPKEALIERFASYPFDIVADLEEAATWGEKNPDAIPALIALCGEADVQKPSGRP
jgi:hypothetical protein